jgi:drug/metabolite transporter (DMT)-like permease
VRIVNSHFPLYALAASVLFGISTPAAKLLLGTADSFVIAGLLYAGSGLGLGMLRAVATRHRTPREESLKRGDVPWLAGAITFGGVIGPILLMVGLARTQAATASLLLTVEGVATALIAWFAFDENFDRRIFGGMVCIVGGAMVLVWRGDQISLSNIAGPLAIIAACIAWGIDNNLTRKVALADPVEIAMLKGLVAAPVTLTLAFLSGAELPPLPTAALAAVVGFFGYGVSLVLFVLALRHLGTARTGAYFSTAPFIGAIAAIPLLGEAPSPQLVIAGALMGTGIWLHLSERHEHRHRHTRFEHSHGHTHDAHHQHGHDTQTGPHTHPHVHEPVTHAHPHAPDSHHRHGHDPA